MGFSLLWTRVDNRLVHGQIGALWVGEINPAMLVVADDKTASDSIQQSVMKMTADMYHVGICFCGLKDCADVIEGLPSSSRVLLVVRDVPAAKRLVETGIPITELNIGNLHNGQGKHASKDPDVCFSEEDEEDIIAMKQTGVHVFIQTIPANPAIDL